LLTSPRLDAVVAEIRRAVPHYSSDRFLADELNWAKQGVLSGQLAESLVAELFAD
jgi:histidine ammonia-lyase